MKNSIEYIKSITTAIVGSLTYAVGLVKMQVATTAVGVFGWFGLSMFGLVAMGKGILDTVFRYCNKLEQKLSLEV